MRVKFGPTVAQFRGEAKLAYDHTARRCSIERCGDGSAQCERDFAVRERRIVQHKPQRSGHRQRQRFHPFDLIIRMCV